MSETDLNSPTNERQHLTRTAMGILEKGTPQEVVDLLADCDPLLGTRVFGDLQNQLYWKWKNVQLASAMGREGLERGLREAEALDAVDKERADKLRAAAKGLAFDLGSFNWPGWDEPGIALHEEDIAAGFDAAKINLRLALDLNKPDLPLSRAHWLVGAYELATGDLVAAARNFTMAAERANCAGEPAEAMLNRGYALIATQLANPDDGQPREEYASLRGQLETEKDGDAFVSQLETALKVFTRPG